MWNSCAGIWEVPFVRYSYDVPGIANERGMSEEEAGRVVRYEAFEQEAGKFVQGKIAVAHNQNDNAETMLHHLIRGSHLTGLAGIAPVRGRIIRPLLCVGREEIEAYLRERGQEYRTDATNFETVYTRNRIRHEILPILQEINPSAISHMVRTADVLRETCEYLDMQAGALAEQAVVYEENEAMIQGEKLREVPALLQNQALYQALAGCPGTERIYRRSMSRSCVSCLDVRLENTSVCPMAYMPSGTMKECGLGRAGILRKKKRKRQESPLWKRRDFPSAS